MCAGSVRRAHQLTATHCCPTTCASPTPYPASDDRPLQLARDPPAHLRRPPAGRLDRAPRVPDPVVARDVRARAVQGGRHLPRRLRRRDDGRLPDLLPLRHGLASDERLGRPEPPARGDRQRAALCARRARGRPGGADHARGAPVQPRRDPALRAVRLPLRRHPAALLPGQRRGRADHVAHPGDAARDLGGRARRAGQRFPRRRALILALETSCDDTCAAVITRAGELRSNVISSQGVHDRYGGVVPEIASRHHLELINAVVDDALARAQAGLGDVELVAVTQGPGLVGALLVGVATAKGLAAAHRKPLAPVDHLQGHVAANYLRPDPIEPPFLCLIASGGHTLLTRVTDHRGFERLGTTLDDAAGEAFDKGARMLGLGFPGGPALSQLATAGDPRAFEFPTARRVAGLDFSFAGLKTALLYKIRELGEEETARRAADLAAAYEHAIVETLILRVERALRDEPGARLAIGGGVAANRLLRERARGLGVPVHIPPPALCTDNAAMIASAARWVEP